ncbi:hypothetical protein UPYG_G00064530 [Umbra pygmaea]|uniref:NADH dehydrogenase subunit 6 n=1 Tax=Umbra pygmaea TaxID=75934 RepID=A0ABD0XA34_UMBPY
MPLTPPSTVMSDEPNSSTMSPHAALFPVICALSLLHLHNTVLQQWQIQQSTMSWMFLDWFVPVYLLVSVLVLVGFGACLYFLEPGLQDAHKWSNRTVKRHPLVVSVNCKDDDSNALI